MSDASNIDIDYVANLARLQLTPEEKQAVCWATRRYPRTLREA